MNETTMALAILLAYTILSVGIDIVSILWMMKRSKKATVVLVILGAIGTVIAVPKLMTAMIVTGIAADIFAVLSAINIAYAPLIVLAFMGISIRKKIDYYRRFRIWP